MGNSASKKTSRPDTSRDVSNTNVRTKPIENPKSGRWGLRIKHADLIKIIAGFQPVEMEDKWVVRSDALDRQGDIIVHFYRSWTGHETFRIRIIPDNRKTDSSGIIESGGAEIAEITWGRAFKEEDAKETVTLICTHTLGCKGVE